MSVHAADTADVLSTGQPLLSVKALRMAAQLGAVFFAYLIAGKLGQATSSIRSSNLGPVWPAFGIALAAVLLYGYRVWFVVASAAFLVAFWSPVNAVAALGQATGATLAVLFGGLALRSIQSKGSFRESMLRVRDALWFVLFGAIGAPVISASIGIASLYLTHARPYSGLLSSWLVYWLGDSTGALLVTPLVITSVNLLKVSQRGRLWECALLLTLAITSSVLIFGGTHLVAFNFSFLALAALPFAIWGAIRMCTAVASLSVLIIATIATVATALGNGPFAGHSPLVSAISLDIFFIVVSISTLLLGAAVAEATEFRIAEEPVSSVNRRLIEAQERERTRIAAELHDNIGQSLALVAIEAERMLSAGAPILPEIRSGLENLKMQIDQAASETHALSHEMHSSKLKYLGMVPSLRGFCREFSERYRATVRFEEQGTMSEVSSEVSLCLFRVLQEALNNAAKHSGVLQFQVRVWETSGNVHLSVSDSGRGFDFETTKGGLGLGLISMRERVRALDGRFTVDSQPLAGTTIHAWVPRNSQSMERQAS